MRPRVESKGNPKSQLVYAYCVIDNNDLKEGDFAFSFNRGSGSNLGLGRPYIISYHEIGAIVSSVSAKNFSQEAIDRNTKNVEWLSKTATKHEELVEHVMKVTTPVPLKLCTIFKGRERVLSMLKRNYATFCLALTELRGKVELGVSAYVTLDAGKLTKQTENRTIKSLQRKVENASEGRAYFLKQELDEMVVSEFATRALASSRNVYEELKPLAERALINKPIATDVGGRKSSAKTDMIMNAAFLVARDRMANFERRFEQLRMEYNSKGISLKLTGPWPPYNFAQQ
jgi:hypothetical protein